jgi:hypothetical protein
MLRREPGSKHAAHRVPDDEGLVYLQVLQQQARIARHVVEVVRNDRLRRPAEADLIGHDHAEAFLAKRVNWPAPVEAAEVHPVEKNHGAAVRLPLCRHVHVGHPDVLAVQRHGQIRDRVRIRDILAGDAGGRDIRRRRWRRRRLGQDEVRREDEHGERDQQAFHDTLPLIISRAF